MTPDEELERRGNHYIVNGNEEYPFCLNCNLFIYIDEAGRCMRCQKRNIVWRPIPAYPTDEMLARHKREILAAAAICIVLGGLVLFYIFH